MPKFAILLLLAATTLSAQRPAPPTSAVPGTPDAQGSTASPAFEVASIKPNNTGNGNSGTNYDGHAFTADNETLKDLIASLAYDIPASRIFGGPKWLDSTHFDIHAKLDEETAAGIDKLKNPEKGLQERALFQQLLADRFKLKIHWETRQLPIYALIALKSGTKLTSADPKQAQGWSVNSNGTSIKFKQTGATISEFAQSLTTSAFEDLGRPVVDQTGIHGQYDLTVNWTRENNRHDATSNADSGSDPDIFKAIQEQLGLKLDSSKGPVQVLVIDQVSLPTEN